METPSAPEIDIVQLALEHSAAQPDSVKLRREHPRLLSDDIFADCGIIHMGSVINRHTVPLVDVSAGGIQIIWPCFIHCGTQLCITIARPGHKEVRFKGKSAWCEFLRGRFHAVGVQACSPIPVHDLVSQQEWLKACASHPELQHPVSGKLVVFGQNELTTRSAFFQVRDSKVTPTQATTRGELIDMVERSSVDIIVIDADPEECDTSEILDACRSRTFNGPIILMSMDKETKFLAQMDELKRCRHVQLPMSNGAIMAAIREIVRDHPDCMVDSSPIYSESPPSPHRKEALERFIELTKEMCAEAQHAIDGERMELVNKIVTSIAASGGSHGYPELSTAAIRYLTAAYDPTKSRSLHSLLRTISSVVDRLESGNCKCPERD